ncbi:hypothetical protein L3X38_031882 [Prunus dulcis]|uniref:Uncharacterized protein n=1 Tax=Prunus dulcis TaxID=3755 RepID=A0AAD4YVD1_PRUDU|nr:hypothetical protein L3X38_031882 [Prunus dulcis]
MEIGRTMNIEIDDIATQTETLDILIILVDYVHSDFPLVIVPPQSSQKPSSSRSSLVSFSAEGKSKVELQETAQQLISQASQMEDNDDTPSPRSQSSTSQPHQPSSQKTSQKDSTPKLQWADDEDSQDPYDLNSD